MAFDKMMGDYIRREELEERMEYLENLRGIKQREREAKGTWAQWLGFKKVEVVLTREEERAKAFREWVDRE